MTTRSDDDLESKALLKAYLGGNEWAFDCLYEKHKWSVRALAVRSLHTIDRDPRVDDMSQETWLAMIRGAAAFRGDSSFSTWLLGIAENVCKMELRRAKREAAHLAALARSGLVAREVPAPSYEDLDRDDFAHDLKRAVARLPAEERDAFRLRQEEGLTFREISERKRISLGWAQKLIERGLESLRVQLAKYGPDARLVKIRSEALDGFPRERRPNH